MGLQRRVLIYCSANLGIFISQNLSISYNTANKIKKQQDQYCRRALAGKWKDIGNYPENLQWEALVDVLRGRVKVIEHCVGLLNAH
jgi:hypothetical protein